MACRGTKYAHFQTTHAFSYFYMPVSDPTRISTTPSPAQDTAYAVDPSFQEHGQECIYMASKKQDTSLKKGRKETRMTLRAMQPVGGETLRRPHSGSKRAEYVVAAPTSIGADGFQIYVHGAEKMARRRGRTLAPLSFSQKCHVYFEFGAVIMHCLGWDGSTSRRKSCTAFHDTRDTN